MSSSTAPVRRGPVPLGLPLIAAQGYQVVVFPDVIAALLAEPG